MDESEQSSESTCSLNVLLMTIINYCVDMKAEQEYKQLQISLSLCYIMPIILLIWGILNLITQKTHWGIFIIIASFFMYTLCRNLKKKCTKDFFILKARLQFLKFFNAIGISTSVENLIQEVNNNWNSSNNNENQQK